MRILCVLVVVMVMYPALASVQDSWDKIKSIWKARALGDFQEDGSFDYSLFVADLDNTFTRQALEENLVDLPEELIDKQDAVLNTDREEVQQPEIAVDPSTGWPWYWSDIPPQDFYDCLFLFFACTDNEDPGWPDNKDRCLNLMDYCNTVIQSNFTGDLSKFTTRIPLSSDVITTPTTTTSVLTIDISSTSTESTSATSVTELSSQPSSAGTTTQPTSTTAEQELSTSDKLQTIVIGTLPTSPPEQVSSTTASTTESSSSSSSSPAGISSTEEAVEVGSSTAAPAEQEESTLESASVAPVIEGSVPGIELPDPLQEEIMGELPEPVTEPAGEEDGMIVDPPTEEGEVIEEDVEIDVETSTVGVDTSSDAPVTEQSSTSSTDSATSSPDQSSTAAATTTTTTAEVTTASTTASTTVRSTVSTTAATSTTLSSTTTTAEPTTSKPESTSTVGASNQNLEISGLPLPPVPDPASCDDLFTTKGISESGVYTIFVNGENIQVYCDMTTEGGGWTVLQRRDDFGNPENYFFNRTFDDYKKGFGNQLEDHWIGLTYWNNITLTKAQQLLIELETWDGNTTSVLVNNFIIGTENFKFRVIYASIDGDVGDSFPKKGTKFSTVDNDNDSWSKNCAARFEGAWWYSACHNSNLNGLYLRGEHESFGNGVNWFHWTGYHYSLKRTEMKIRSMTKAISLGQILSRK